ncbi:MAG: TolC family protein [Bacteroidia bacterium]|nr:TolC family protein [Bacteroidia bacterium]
MTTRKLILWILLLTGPVLTAQQAFTLKEAVEFAYTHQYSVLNAQLEEQLNRAKQKEVTGMGLPQISGSFDIKDYLDIPTQLMPGEFFMLPPGTYIPVKFGLQYNANAGINVSQLLFSSDYLIALQASSEFNSLARKNLERARVETALAVSKAYYSVLVNRERLELLKANAEKVKKLLDDTRVLHQNGFVEKIDVDRVEVIYNNLVTEQEKVGKLIGIAEALLKFQMGMDVTQPIELKDKLDPVDSPQPETPDGPNPDFGARSEYALMQSQLRLNTLELRRHKMSYLPSLVAYGTFNLTAQRNEFDFFDFSDGHDWYPMTIVGVTLNVPIFNGGQKYYRMQQSKINRMITENTIKNLENAIRLEVKAAAVNYNNAILSLTTQKKNMELAKNVYDVSKKKYDQGVGSNLEVIDAQTSYREAQTNYFSALYDYYISKLELEKAKGTLK